MRKAALSRLLISIVSTTPTPLYVIYRHTFHFSEIVLTLIFAVYIVGTLAALTILGRVSDQVGRRRAMLPAIGVAAVAMTVLLFAGGPAMLFIGRVLSGLSIGVVSGAATAWIVELEPHQDCSRGTLVAAAATQAGVGIGPLLAGLLAQYAPAPLVLPYLLALAILVPAAVLVLHTRETVRKPARRLAEIRLGARFGVPEEIRGRFVPPAATAFATFALLGFNTGLTPTVLNRVLGVTSHAVAGTVVFELYAAAVATLFLTRRLSARAAMYGGLLLMLPALALLTLSQDSRSLAMLVGNNALVGAATALGYRGSLQVVNEIAPGDRRGEVNSAYLVAAYVGTALPVVGIGILTQFFGTAIASLTFAVVIAALALLALAVGWSNKGA